MILSKLPSKEPRGLINFEHKLEIIPDNMEEENFFVIVTI